MGTKHGYLDKDRSYKNSTKEVIVSYIIIFSDLCNAFNKLLDTIRCVLIIIYLLKNSYCLMC